MEKKLIKTFWLMVLILVLLAGGEYYLYRKIMVVNRMVSEGLMQIKEINKAKTSIVPTMKVRGK